MQVGWRLHQSSSLKARVGWCLLYASYALFETEVASGTLLPALNGYLVQPNYQRVTVSSASRPLIYLLSDGTSAATLAGSITAFRSACTAAAVGNPYVVLLGSTAAGAASAAGADAVGNYAWSTPAQIAGSYAQLVGNAEAEWATLAATGQATVPTAMTGWARQPRVERPVPWEAAAQAPYVGWGQYFAAGAPAQIAAHVGDMVTWLTAHASAAPAQTGLIYSWNEHDEGGSTLTRRSVGPPRS